MNYTSYNLILTFILCYIGLISAIQYYPLVSNLVTTNSQNNLTVVASCNQTSDIYYAIYVSNGIRPSFEQLKQKVPYAYSYEYYGVIDSSLDFTLTFSIMMNSNYNVDVYCLSYDSTYTYSYLSYPQTVDNIKTPDNQSKTMILKMYFTSQPTDNDLQSIVCKATTKFPTYSNRIIEGSSATCVQTNTTQSFQTTFSISYQEYQPYLVTIYFLEDLRVLLDELPEELNLYGASDLSTYLISNTSLTLTNSSLIDASIINTIPILNVVLQFSSSILNIQACIENIDGIIAIGISELGATVEINNFFVNQSSTFVMFDLISVEQNTYVTYEVNNLTIGNDYIVNVVGLLYPQAQSIHNGILRMPILASRIKSLEINLISVFLIMLLLQ